MHSSADAQRLLASNRTRSSGPRLLRNTPSFRRSRPRSPETFTLKSVKPFLR